MNLEKTLERYSRSDASSKNRFTNKHLQDLKFEEFDENIENPGNNDSRKSPNLEKTSKVKEEHPRKENGSINIEILFPEAKEQIFKYLNGRSFLYSSQVCTTWNAAARKSETFAQVNMWKNNCEEQIPNEVLDEIVSANTNGKQNEMKFWKIIYLFWMMSNRLKKAHKLRAFESKTLCLFADYIVVVKYDSTRHPLDYAPVKFVDKVTKKWHFVSHYCKYLYSAKNCGSIRTNASNEPLLIYSYLNLIKIVRYEDLYKSLTLVKTVTNVTDIYSSKYHGNMFALQDYVSIKLYELCHNSKTGFACNLLLHIPNTEYRKIKTVSYLFYQNKLVISNNKESQVDFYCLSTRECLNSFKLKGTLCGIYFSPLSAGFFPCDVFILKDSGRFCSVRKVYSHLLPSTPCFTDSNQSRSIKFFTIFHNVLAVLTKNLVLTLYRIKDYRDLIKLTPQNIIFYEKCIRYILSKDIFDFKMEMNFNGKYLSLFIYNENEYVIYHFVPDL